MKNVAANIRFWLTGTGIALTGVAATRVVAPHLAREWKLVFTLGGQCLALAGLAIIAIGVSRRVRQANNP